MSYDLGTKVRLTQPWRAYSAGDILEQGFEVDLEGLVRSGAAVKVDEAEAGGRPAKMARTAAKKIADGARGLFKS